jgi:hypothetical protein
MKKVLQNQDERLLPPRTPRPPLAAAPKKEAAADEAKRNNLKGLFPPFG